ncbi:MAG TPA: DotU family type IV/VI secretion system protein [Bryobacteraceae bacterium]|nr:DotU family type IV/VI secretion system protein [Bryobacteraceae bacterium]
MGSYSAPTGTAAAAWNERRRDNLALVFQEVLTAVIRLRTNRQVVTDSELFRTQMREALNAADQEGRKRAYTGEQTRMAIFAVVAFLDESILNLQQPVFAEWPRKPMQEELFGVHVAGEIFFNTVQRLLAQQDAHDVADVLEIYLLCLLLGFRGRYGVGGQGELRNVIDAIAEKLRRIRGYSPDLSPAWAIPPGAIKLTQSDPWVKRLLWTAVACFALVVILFGVFKLSLGSGASDLRALPTTESRG